MAFSVFQTDCVLNSLRPSPMDVGCLLSSLKYNVVMKCQMKLKFYYLRMEPRLFL